MTLTQFVDAVRNRHNADSDSFWSDQEIYQLITSRCNEVLAVIGLLEATDTDTSVASTQAYDYPTDATTIYQVDYKNDRLKRIDFRNWEFYKSSSGTNEGTPTMWVPWNRQINLIPVPSTAGDTITIFYYKAHPFIDNSAQTTIDLPSVLHSHLIFGVLSDMFAKDLNGEMANFYEQKWISVAMPAFHKFKATEDTATGFMPIGDADSGEYTGAGVK